MTVEEKTNKQKMCDTIKIYNKRERIFSEMTFISIVFLKNRRRYSQPAAEHYTIYLTIDTSLKNNRRKLLFEIFALLILEGG
jgi:hypothetical protein